MHNNIFLKRADYLHCRNLVGFLVMGGGQGGGAGVRGERGREAGERGREVGREGEGSGERGEGSGERGGGKRGERGGGKQGERGREARIEGREAGREGKESGDWIPPVHPHSYSTHVILERAGAVGSASDFGPRGPRFDPRPGRRLLYC